MIFALLALFALVVLKGFFYRKVRKGSQRNSPNQALPAVEFCWRSSEPGLLLIPLLVLRDVFWRSLRTPVILIDYQLVSADRERDGDNQYHYQGPPGIFQHGELLAEGRRESRNSNSNYEPN